MPNLSGSDWNSYTQQTQSGGAGKPQTPQMFQSMAGGLGQQSGNTATPSPTTLPGGTTATTPGSVTASQPTNLTSQTPPSGGSLSAGTPTTTPGLTPPAGGSAGGSFTVPGLGMVPGLNDFRSFMSYSNPTQQSIKQLMENAGIFNQFAPYLQRDAEASPWALQALGAYGPTGATSPLGGGTGTPFDGYDPAGLMSLLQQHGIASNYTDPTVQTQPTQVPTSQPAQGPAPTPQQTAANRLQDNAAQQTALSAATGGVAGGSADQKAAESIRQNLGGQAAFNQTGGLIAGGQFTDPFAASGFESPYAMAGYVAPGQNGGPHNVYGPGGTFIGYQFPDGSVIGANGKTISGPSAVEGGGQPGELSPGSGSPPPEVNPNGGNRQPPMGYGSPGTTVSNNGEIATINGSGGGAGHAPWYDPVTGQSSHPADAQYPYGVPGPNVGMTPTPGYGSPGTITSPNGEISTISGSGGTGQSLPPGVPGSTAPSNLPTNPVIPPPYTGLGGGGGAGNTGTAQSNIDPGTFGVAPAGFPQGQLPVPGVNLGGNAIGQPGGYGAVAPGAIDPATGLMQGAPNAATPPPGVNLGGGTFPTTNDATMNQALGLVSHLLQAGMGRP